MDKDRTPYVVLYFGQNEGKTNKKNQSIEPIGMIRQNGLIQEDDDDDDDNDEQATCSYCYNFNNYMTNMWNSHTKIT